MVGRIEQVNSEYRVGEMVTITKGKLYQFANMDKIIFPGIHIQIRWTILETIDRWIKVQSPSGRIVGWVPVERIVIAEKKNYN